MAAQPTLGLPDFERLAAVMDRYLPLIEPVGHAVLTKLPPLADGATVLDIACGTGEPGLTIARLAPAVQLLGIDGVRAMVDIATAKAAKEELANAKFEVMSAERLECGDESFDAVVSRFGLLMFGDTVECARELKRVLKPDGAFSFAVWDDMATNTLVRVVIAALKPHVPAELIAPFDSTVGAKAGTTLKEIGLDDAQTETFEWHYAFANEEELWEFVSGPGLFAKHFAAITAEKDLAKVRKEVTTKLKSHKKKDGSYQIPHTCRLYWRA